MELIYLEIIGHFTLPSSDVQTQIGGGLGETEQFAEPIWKTWPSTASPFQ